MNLKRGFLNSDAAVRLIYVNVGVFVLVAVARLLLRLFLVPAYTDWLALPASWGRLALRPWTLLTYMFMHDGFWHLFFNMLCLFWFGKIVLSYVDARRLVGLYLFGGLLGGLVYLLCYNLLPLYRGLADATCLVGASGAIMAIIVMAAMLAPDMELRLLFVGRVKLKWIAVGVVAVSVLGITGANAGGQLAHVGGAIGGYLFARMHARGVDITKPFMLLADRLSRLAGKRQDGPRRGTKYHYQRPTRLNTERMTDAQYNQQRARHTQEVDAILDKIKASGYSSLTEEEKRKLFS